MSKLTRKEKKAEEARIIAEMDAAMQEKQAQEGATASSEEQTVQTEPAENVENGSRSGGFYDDTTPAVIHCKRCKTLMENGVCPTCGFHIYVPMDKKKRDKIRVIVAAVCMALFVILFIVMEIKKG